MLDASLKARSTSRESLELALAAYKSLVSGLTLENRQMREICAQLVDPLVAANVELVVKTMGEHQEQTLAERAVQQRGVLEALALALNATIQTTPDSATKARLIEILQPLSIVLKG